MNIAGFTDSQKERLLDLLLMGMYSDFHLARSEEARIQKLLDGFQFPSSHARNQFADASIARVRSLGASPDTTADVLAKMAKEFESPDVRRKAADALEVLLFSDSKLIGREREFLANVRKAFGC